MISSKGHVEDTLYLLFIVIYLSSCTSTDENQTHSFQIFEEDGITVAETRGGHKYQGELFEFEEIVRLEQDESREETLLFRATQYLMGEDGNFFVNDRGNGRIAVFGPDGKYVRSFGRDGDGPGEFRSPRLLWIRSNILAVFDTRHDRTSLFNMDGTFLQSFFYSRGGSISELHPVPDGCMVILDSESTPFLQSDPVYRTYMVTVVTADGDTLSQVRAPPFSQGRIIMLEEYGIGVSNLPYFAPRSGASYYPDKGILVYSTAEPEFTWYGLDGNPLSIIRIDMEPEPVTDEDRRAIKKMLDEGIKSAPDEQREALAKLRKKHANIPDTKSYWTSIVVDDGGYYWLSGHPDYGADGMERYRRPYKVLSRDGEYLGDSVVPELIFTISHGHILSFHEDEESGESIFVVYRITPVVDGLKYP